MAAKLCKIISGILLGALGLLALLSVGPLVLGWQSYVVLTPSMSPAIPTGSVVHVQPVAPETIQAGDVITFHLPADDTMVMTHRVADILPESREFITKGDANQATDPAISFDRLVGRMKFSIPYLGFVIQTMKSRNGILMGGGLLIVLVLLLFLPDILKKPEEDKSQPNCEPKNI